MELPRILFSAFASGKGKTMITCGILKCLKSRGVKLTAFKCGPDYIDPMFHREVLGIDSYNLDTFLCGRESVPDRLAQCAGQSELAVIEGVMGYFDGIGGISADASTYDVADASRTPVVMIVDCKGASLSVVPCIQGFLGYRTEKVKDTYIRGIILNRVSRMQYKRMKELIERECEVKVYGYVPEMTDIVLESRHLGLKRPDETEDFQEKLKILGKRLEETVDIDGLLRLAGTAPDITHRMPQLPVKKYKLRIGAARDEAFCFIYKDNLELLEQMGAELVFFSPLSDTGLPEKLDGLILYGGYPELYAGSLSRNRQMRTAIRTALKRGLPCIAECGGFMYLQEQMEGADGEYYEMVGALKGKSFRTDSLQRFGYIMLEKGRVFGMEAGKIPAHEFHYYNSEECGNAFQAKKPLSERRWECMISTDTILAGYPHICYAGNVKVAEAFLEACEKGRG